MSRAIAILLFMILAVPPGLCGAGKGLASSGDKEATGSSKAKGQEGDLLLLVRSWDAATGELLGWMPMHRLAVTLERLGGKVSIDVDSTVTMRFVPHSQAPANNDQEISFAPDAVSFRGRKWLPVERENNVVRIGKAYFYLKTINFETDGSGGSTGAKDSQTEREPAGERK